VVAAQRQEEVAEMAVPGESSSTIDRNASTMEMEDIEPSCKISRRPSGFEDAASANPSAISKATTTTSTMTTTTMATTTTPMEAESDDSNGVSSEEDQRPLAPRLCDYTAPGGTRKYRPRPEWCQYIAPPSACDEAQQQHCHRPGMSASSPRLSRQVHSAAAQGERSHHHDQQHHHHHHHNNNRIQRQEGEGEGEASVSVGDNHHHAATQPVPGPMQVDDGEPAAAYPDYLEVAPGEAVSLNPYPPVDEMEVNNNIAGDEAIGPEDMLNPNIDDDNSQTNDTEAAVGGYSVARASNPNPVRPFHPSTFGRDFDFALHVAIREGATQAALELLAIGAPVDSENAKGVTPLILASQKGNLSVVQALLRRGASASATTVTGTTAVLQAAHFGHVDVMHALVQAAGARLIEIANYNHTTPLMRAAQEGHSRVIQYLLSRGALVNRRNRLQMTALMLASQRGHADICRMLIENGADLDAMTDQHSTSLLLACKRAHIEVVRILVTAGCELFAQDARGRTARDATERRDLRDLTYLLDPLVQVYMMRREARKQRSWSLIRMWTLLQKERASIPWERHAGDVTGNNTTIHEIAPLLIGQQGSATMLRFPYRLSHTSTQALIRTMALPSPLVEAIAQYAPIPSIWDKRIGLLTRQCLVNANAAVAGGLDLVDEVMEEGGFLVACDMAQVPPPPKFASWVSSNSYMRRERAILFSFTNSSVLFASREHGELGVVIMHPWHRPAQKTVIRGPMPHWHRLLDLKIPLVPLC
jgi:uncharacterized protein